MPTHQRPNIVIFMADQLRADALSPFAPGRKTAHPPVFDELAPRSTVFDEAFVQHPVCGPSRVSMMTGWYLHVHGHRTLTNLLKPLGRTDSCTGPCRRAAIMGRVLRRECRRRKGSS